jgi:hypothetical protein
VPTFRSFWYGDQLPTYQRLAMKSFVDFGHTYELFTYRKFDVPDGVTLRDASEILPETRVFFYGDQAGTGRGSVSAFSNLFRYHLLKRFGDWWVDADVVCLSDKIPSDEIFMGWEYEDLVGTALLKFPASHPLLSALVDAAERNGREVDWGASGPNLLTRLVQEQSLLHLLAPQPFAYPVQSRDALHVLMPAQTESVRERVRGSPFLHLWNEIFRRAVVFTWMAPPPGSFVGELFERHGISFGGAMTYTADQITRLNENYYRFTLSDWDRKQIVLAHNELKRERELTAALRHELETACEQFRALADESAQFRQQIEDLRNSRSWRATSMLRSMGRYARSLRSRLP